MSTPTTPPTSSPPHTTPPSNTSTGTARRIPTTGLQQRGLHTSRRIPTTGLQQRGLHTSRRIPTSRTTPTTPPTSSPPHTTPSSNTSPSHDPSTAYDAIIVGAGVIGNATALELARAGHKTLSIDKLGVAGAGSTSYSSGVVRLNYSLTDSVRMAFESYRFFEDWQDYVQLHRSADKRDELASLRQCGGVVLNCPRAGAFIRKVERAFQEVGVPFEWWSNSELEKKLMLDVTCTGPPKRIDDEEFGEPAAAHGGGPGATKLEGGLYCLCCNKVKQVSGSMIHGIPLPPSSSPRPPPHLSPTSPLHDSWRHNHEWGFTLLQHSTVR